MKKIKVGINGFGRIGRVATRIAFARPDVDVVAINSRAQISSHAYLLKHDSTYGTWSKEVSFNKDVFIVDRKYSVYCLNYDLPSLIPWDKYGVDIVIDATGKFTKNEDLAGHLKGSVKHVVLSAPAKDATKTVVMGVNHESFDPAEDKIVSNSSCTTNCLATTLKVLIDSFGVKRGFMTTTHAVTDSQNLLDNSHKKEVRLRRAAFASIIPASTGSAKDIGKLYPDLVGKILCQSVRVPLLTVSLLNLIVETKKIITVELINSQYEKASKGKLKGILSVANEELVSHDFVGNPYSSTIDPFLTAVSDGNLVSISAWYDNEWGYTGRVIDLVSYIGRKAGLL